MEYRPIMKRIAVHEAGHVAAWRDLARPIFAEKGFVLINAIGYGQTGLGRGTWIWGPASMPPQDQYFHGIIAMAGRAAEALWYPMLPDNLSGEDEQNAYRLFHSLYGHSLLEPEVSMQVDRWQAEATEIICRVRPGVLTLAETLVARLMSAVNEEAEFPGSEAMEVIDVALGRR